MNKSLPDKRGAKKSRRIFPAGGRENSKEVSFPRVSSRSV